MGRRPLDYQGALLARLQGLPATPWLPDAAQASLALLSRGAYHCNYLLSCIDTNSVVRINERSQWQLSSEEQLQREYATLVDLADSGVTPKPLALIQGNPPLLIEEFIEGDQFSYSKGLKAAAEAIAQVHQQPVRYARAYLPVEEPHGFLLDDGLRWLSMARQARSCSRTVRLLLRAEEWLRRRPMREMGEAVIVHTDLTATNFLVRGKSCAIVDWEAARRAPAAWDLAYFLSPLTTRWAKKVLTEAERRRFIGAYVDATGLEYETQLINVEALMPAVLFRALAWCVGFRATENYPESLSGRLKFFTAPGFVERVLFDELLKI